MDFDIPTGKMEAPAHDPSKRHARHQAEALATSLKDAWENLKEAIQTSQARMSSRENEKRHNPTLAVGDLANLDTRHFSCGRPTLKLDYRWTGPYRVEAVHGGLAKLALPAGSKRHPTVNLSYLHRFNNNPLPGQATDAESPNPVIAGGDPSEDEFEVTRIVDASINRQYRGGRLHFRVSWRGWPDDPTWYNADDGEFSHAKDALDEFYALPSTVVRPPRSVKVSPPSPPTDKSRDEPSFPGGGGVTGRRPSTRSYKHLSQVPEPVTLHSRLVHICLFTSLHLDYLTFPFSSCIFLFLLRTQHEPLTKLLCQDLAQHNTVYSSFSRSFLSFLSKFLILYVRSIKQLNIYVAFPAPLHFPCALTPTPTSIDWDSM